MKKLFILIGIIFLLQLIAAVICGPYSCEWGNGFYFGVGLFSLISILFVVLIQTKWDVVKRLAYTALFSFLSIVVWCLGFIIGDFTILCRLF
ncbi:MAG TPA: hypothetical protein VFN95_08335 [Flavitalea sp.]|nr:hypothetical protein [Flavitalea sp.]